jgi:2-deoxy-D-gluconate 3-dehydrogenase
MNTVFTITRDAGRHMLESRGGVAGEAVPSEFNKNGNGKIINISSLVAYQGGLNVVAYAAAKHGVQGMVKSFSNGWASKGINVNAIAPGYIATDVSAQPCSADI